MISKSFKIRKSDINGLKKRMERIGRDSHSWLEILQLDLPSFKKIARNRDIVDVKKYMKKLTSTLTRRS